MFNDYEEDDKIEKIRCPNCGKYSRFFNGCCSYCHMKYNENARDYIGNFQNKKAIEEENNQYTEFNNHLSYYDGLEKKYSNINDIQALYFSLNALTRVGITRIEKVDYENQAVIGDFQAIDNKGKTFIIENVYQQYGESPMVFFNGELINKRTIHHFKKNNNYAYVVLRKLDINSNLMI